jgi:hypothetical protein
MRSQTQTVRLLVHIGLPKTASTWLQKVLFDNPAAGMTSPWGAPSGLAVQHFITVDSFSFDPARTRAIFQPALEAAWAQGLTPVLSQEMLGGDHVAGRYWGKEVADRLKAVFPEARLLVMVREQSAMILSAFGQYIRNGGEGSLLDFISESRMSRGFAPICQLHFLEYDKLVAYYQGLFGRDEVLVLPAEALKRDRVRTLAKLLAFTGQASSVDLELDDRPVNINYGAATLELHRTLNRYLPKPDYSGRSHPLAWRVAWKALREIDERLPKRMQARRAAQWSGVIAEQVGTRFRASNRRLERLTGLELSTLGYDVEVE